MVLGNFKNGYYRVIFIINLKRVRQFFKPRYGIKKGVDIACGYVWFITSVTLILMQLLFRYVEHSYCNQCLNSW